MQISVEYPPKASNPWQMALFKMLQAQSSEAEDIFFFVTEIGQSFLEQFPINQEKILLY